MEKAKTFIKESQVFEVLRGNEDLTIAEICTRLDCGDFSVRKHVKALMARNVIQVYRDDHQNFYSATPEYKEVLKNVAGPRTFEFKPLTGYDMTAGMRLAEGARNKETGYV